MQHWVCVLKPLLPQTVPPPPNIAPGPLTEKTRGTVSGRPTSLIELALTQQSITVHVPLVFLVDLAYDLINHQLLLQELLIRLLALLLLHKHTYVYTEQQGQARLVRRYSEFHAYIVVTAYAIIRK